MAEYLKTIVIMLLMISGVMIGTGIFYADLAGSYGKTATDINGTANNTMIASYQKLSEQYQTMQSGQENAPASGLGSTFDLPQALVSAGSSALTTIISIPQNFINLFNVIFSMAGLPTWFGGLVFGIIFVSVLFGFMSIVLKGRV